jgi:hypothetical protein
VLIIFEDDGHPTFTRELRESGCREALVPHIDGVTQPHAMSLARQQVEKAQHVVGIKCMARIELPEQRAELGAELHDAAVDESP